MELNVYTVVAHEAMTSNMKTFTIKTLPHVTMDSVLETAYRFAADAGLVFDTVFPVVSL